VDVPRRTGSQLTHVEGLPLGTRRHSRESRSPSDGEYVINIADMVANIWGNGLEYENPVVVTSTTRSSTRPWLAAKDNKFYDQVFNGAFDRVNARLKNIRFSTTGGPHRVGVASNTDLRRVRRSAADSAPAADRIVCTA
jgi:hypothetical protein